jgi:hypothetical protein
VASAHPSSAATRYCLEDFPQQLAGGARHRDASGEEVGFDDANAQPVADQLRLHFDRRHDVGQAKHVDRQARRHEICAAVTLLDDMGEEPDDDATVHRFRIPWTVRDRVGDESFAARGEERLVGRNLRWCVCHGE